MLGLNTGKGRQIMKCACACTATCSSEWSVSMLLFVGLFNVSREKSGRPGRSGDVMDAVGLSPPTGPRNRLHTETLARIANGTAGQCTSQGVRVERTINKNDNGGSSGSTFSLKRVAR